MPLLFLYHTPLRSEIAPIALTGSVWGLEDGGFGLLQGTRTTGEGNRMSQATSIRSQQAAVAHPTFLIGSDAPPK